MIQGNGTHPPEFRSGYVALIGEPNVGKSTLLNSLIGSKISIVTSKPQTTRHKILGIINHPCAQIVCLDTPGIISPKYLLHEVMMDAVYSAVDDVDVVCAMVDLTGPKKETDDPLSLLIPLLRRVKRPLYLILNKIDAVQKEEVLRTIAVLSPRFAFREIFPLSALTGQGTRELLDALIKEMPVHPPYYPSDQLSEQSERFFVSEIIREKVFEFYREEIPYSTTVDIVEFTEEEGRKDLIRAEIYVERVSQKGILIGKRGNALKTVGELARKDIEAFLGRPVFLELFIKVREKWRNDKSWLKRLGYGI